MAGASISDLRAAMAEQLKNNIDAETNIDAFNNTGMPFPRIRISLGGVPRYTETYSGLAGIPFVLSIEPAGIDESSVRRLDAYLSAGLGNNSSVVDALRVKDGPLYSVATHVEIDADDGSYDAENVTAELVVRVHVLKIRS